MPRFRLTMRQLFVASLVAPLVVFWVWCVWWHAMYDMYEEKALTGDDVVRNGQRVGILRYQYFAVGVDGSLRPVETMPPPHWLRDSLIGVLILLLVWRLRRKWQSPPRPRTPSQQE